MPPSRDTKVDDNQIEKFNACFKNCEVDENKLPVTLAQFFQYTNVRKIVEENVKRNLPNKVTEKIIQELGKLWYLDYYNKPETRTEGPLKNLKIIKNCPKLMRKRLNDICNNEKPPPMVIANESDSEDDKPSTSAKARDRLDKQRSKEEAYKSTSNLPERTTKGRSILQEENNITNNEVIKTPRNAKPTPSDQAPRKRSILIAESDSDSNSERHLVTKKIRTTPQTEGNNITKYFNVVEKTKQQGVVLSPKVGAANEERKHKNDNKNEEIKDQTTKKEHDGNDENLNPLGATVCAKIIGMLGNCTKDLNPKLCDFPVNFKQFKQFTFYHETIEAILRDVADGNEAEYQKLKQNVDIRNFVIEQYYGAYYMNPVMRDKYKLRLKMCPKRFKDQLVLSLDDYYQGSRPAQQATPIRSVPQPLCSPNVTHPQSIEVESVHDEIIEIVSSEEMECNETNTNPAPEVEVNNKKQKVPISALTDKFLLSYIAARSKCKDVNLHKTILQRIRTEVLGKLDNNNMIPPHKEKIQIQSVQILPPLSSENLTKKVINKPNIAIQTTIAEETKEPTKLTPLERAKKFLQRHTHRFNTLAYIIGTNYGVKQCIIYVVKQMSLTEFKRYIRWYNEPDIFNDISILKHCHKEIFVKEKVWPPFLYITLMDLVTFLATKELKFYGLSLKYVSPVLVHWSDLIDATNFDECVRFEYYKTTRQEIKDEELLQQRREIFYKRCWKNDAWLRKTPMITHRALIEHIEKVNDEVAAALDASKQKAQNAPIVNPISPIKKKEYVNEFKSKSTQSIRRKSSNNTAEVIQKDSTVVNKSTQTAGSDSINECMDTIPGKSPNKQNTCCQINFLSQDISGGHLVDRSVQADLSGQKQLDPNENILNDHNYNIYRNAVRGYGHTSTQNQLSQQSSESQLLQNLPEMLMTSTQRSSQVYESPIFCSDEVNDLLISPNIFSSECESSGKSTSVPPNATSLNCHALNMVDATSSAQKLNTQNMNFMVRPSMVSIPTANLERFIRTAPIKTSTKFPTCTSYRRSSVEMETSRSGRATSTRRNTTILCDPLRLQPMENDNFVSVQNTQDQIASLPQEVSIFCDPLEADLMEVLGEPMEKSMEVIKRIKQESFKTLDKLQFNLKDDNSDEFSCVPIVNETIMVEDDSNNLLTQLMDMGDNLPLIPSTLSQLPLSENELDVNTTDFAEGQNLLNSYSRLPSIEEASSDDENNAVVPMASTITRTAAPKIIMVPNPAAKNFAGKTFAAVTMGRKQHFREEFVPQKTHEFRPLQFKRIVNEPKATASSTRAMATATDGHATDSHSDASGTAINATTHSQALRTDMTLFNSSDLHKVVDGRSSQTVTPSTSSAAKAVAIVAPNANKVSHTRVNPTDVGTLQSYDQSISENTRYPH